MLTKNAGTLPRKVRDCGVKASIVKSDHKGVMMKLNMKVKRLQKKPKDKRTVRINKDFSKLSLTAKSDQEREKKENSIEPNM